jgi:hypothetical protein
MNTHTKVSKQMILVLGCLCGLVLLGAESIVAWLSSNTMRPKFFLFAIPAYAILGIAISTFALTIGAFSGRKARRHEPGHADSQVQLTLVPVVLIFVQGVVFLNEIILSGQGFSSTLSLSFDFLWLPLCALIFLAAIRTYARLTTIH